MSGNQQHDLSVGKSYFDELVGRSLMQPAPRGSSDDGRTPPEAFFVIHGLMHDLIRSKSVYENFVTLLVDGEPQASALLDKVRRLSVLHADNGDHHRGIQKSMATARLRTLHVFGGTMSKLRFNRLALLRVLDVEGCKDLTNRDVEEIASGLTKFKVPERQRHARQ